MKAIQVQKSGGPEVLTLVDLPAPKPKPNEAVVKVSAAGVNFIDVHIREGLYPSSLPFVIGQEASGIVSEIGADVKSFKPGDRVAYTGIRGSYAEYAAVPADRLVLLPPGISEQQAAAAMLQGMTAHYLLYDTYPLKKGETALIHAAAGGVGLLLVQMAKNIGARVIATAGTEEKAKLARISYASFLKDIAGVHEDIVKMYQALPHPLFGVGIDAVAAQDAWGLNLPGFDGMKLDPAPGKGMNRDAIPNEEADKYFFHFPDGNASIARLLVRRLIPDAMPGQSATDVVTAKANYSKLDQSNSGVRIRLNSTAVRVKHLGDHASAKEVEVAYARGGKVFTAKAKSAILACWHVVIPYICDELPDKQKEALASAQKVPLLYTNVALRNWTPFQKAGANSIYAPGMYHTYVNLDLPVSIGGYECARKPEEAIVVHMMKTPCRPGRPARDQHRLGRAELFNTTFETMERKIREQLARTLGADGFDPARDIAAITVNRWPHGYAYEYNSLFDPFWLEGGETPCSVARKPFGRIAIANADADAYAYTDSAMDQAYRAVGEITKA